MQLFSSFGIAAFVSLFVVVLTSCLSIYRAGEDVKAYSKELMRGQVHSSLLRSSELLAEQYGSRIDNVEATVQILVEAVKDRIVGYPTLGGWQDGMHVPFEDYYYARGGEQGNYSEGRRYRYPLREPPSPLDWTVVPEGLAADDGSAEFADVRVRQFTSLLSTRSASYHMPGSCDPSLNQLDCSPQRNNVTTGGMLPSETHHGLYRATGDLSVLMKPLYEADPDLMKIQILFVNGGAGSTLQFPAGIIPPQMDVYTSQGCDWMLNGTNPYTGMPFGSNGEHLKCHEEGATVPSRDYNSMEDGTAAMIVAGLMRGSPEDVVWAGPIMASDNTTVIVRAGKAIYDRL